MEVRTEVWIMHRVNAARKDFFTVGFCHELKNVMIRCQPLSLTKLAGRVKTIARPVYETAMLRIILRSAPQTIVWATPPARS